KSSQLAHTVLTQKFHRVLGDCVGIYFTYFSMFHKLFMKNGFYPILIVSLLLLSCGSSRKTTRTEHKTLPEITVSANSPLDIYRVSEPRYWDITHTRAALSFDFKSRTADG